MTFLLQSISEHQCAKRLGLLLLPMLLSIAPGALLALDGEALRQQLRSPDRAIADRMRDDARKPVEVLEFLDLQPGMTALDVYAADGYYTLIMAWAVGEQGRVHAQNSPAVQRYED